MEMKLAASLNRLGTETAFSVLAEAKKTRGKRSSHDPSWTWTTRF
jgi:hypothetical protein